jgi:predicted aminopeptidase
VSTLQRIPALLADMPLSFLPRLALLCLLALALPGCASQGSTLGYYWQSVRGHLQIMQTAEPMDRWMGSPRFQCNK